MSSCCRGAVRWLLFLGVFFAGSSLVRAQKGLEELERDLYKKHRLILVDLLRGIVVGNDKLPEHTEALSAQTEYLTRRFVDAVFVDAPPGSPPKKSMEFLIDQVEVDLKQLRDNKAKNQAAAKLYTHYFCLHAKGVIQKDEKRNPRSTLNLTRALMNLATLGQGELGETLADLIEDDLKNDAYSEAQHLQDPIMFPFPNDGMKYYALRGLQVLLAQPPGPSMVPVVSKEQEVKIVKVLQKLINTTRTFKEGTLQQEIDGFRVRRREAIKALALIANPAVPDKADGAALTLLRVVARDSKLQPEPSIDERLEAAVGLARMKFDKDGEYHPDYAAYNIGLFVDELVTYCNVADGNTKYPRPIHVYAARLLEALESIKTQTKDAANKRADPEKTFAIAAVETCQLVLAKLEKAPESKVNPNDVDLTKLKSWLADAKMPNATLFKGVAGTAVAPPKK